MKSRAAILVRPAVTDDHAAVARLLAELQAQHEKLHPDFFADGTPQSREAFRRLIASPADLALIAIADPDNGGDEIAGVLHATLRDTPSSPDIRPCRRLHVEALVVEKRQRRLGIARALMSAAESWARKHRARQVVLTVWSGNSSAARFYEELSYQAISQTLAKDL